MDKRELAELLMKLAVAVVLPGAVFVVFKAWQLVFGGLDRRQQALLMRRHHRGSKECGPMFRRIYAFLA